MHDRSESTADVMPTRTLVPMRRTAAPGWRRMAAAIALCGAAVPALAQTVVSYTGPAVPIPDNQPSGANVYVQVAGLGQITDVDFRIDALPGCDATPGNPAAGIAHTFVGDLVITLFSPAGTSVTVVNRRGGTRENICNLLLDDDGGFPPLSSLTSVTGQTVAGSFASDAPLLAFDGQNPNGIWRVNVSDNSSVDTGSLLRFSLIISTAAVPVIAVDLLDDPAPGTCTPGSCSLREAVALSNSRAGLDRIVLPAGALQLARAGANEDGNLTGDLDVTGDLEIIGAGATLTSVTQTAVDRLLHATTSGSFLTLRNLRLQGGSGVNGGGAMYLPVNQRLLIEDVTVSGNRALDKGGAIFHGGGVTPGSGTRVVLRRTLFDDNRATNGLAGLATGGAVYSVSSGFGDDYFVVEGCTFNNNRADDGGGALALDAIQSISNVGYRISNSVFTLNQVTLGGRGGAIGTNVQENGVVLLDIATSTFEQNAVAPGLTGDAGGAISVFSGALRSLTDSLLSDNFARVGGAVAASGAELNIADSTLCGNTAVDAGGAVWATNPIEIRRSTLCNNVVTTTFTGLPGGGAVAALGPNGQLDIQRSTLDANSALRGGAISTDGAVIDLRSNTIVAPPTLPVGALGSVLRHNGADGTALMNMFNNILIGQCSYLTAGVVPDAAFHNIEASGNTCRLLLAGTAANNQTVVSGNSINLAALADNGGSTDTRLPQAPSIAIDAGFNFACTALDQRGFARTDALCDVGAVEVSGQLPPDPVFANGFESP
jgi:subtilisin-like proprotein convertase family protein